MGISITLFSVDTRNPLRVSLYSSLSRLGLKHEKYSYHVIKLSRMCQSHQRCPRTALLFKSRIHKRTSESLNGEGEDCAEAAPCSLDTTSHTSRPRGGTLRRPPRVLRIEQYSSSPSMDSVRVKEMAKPQGTPLAREMGSAIRSRWMCPVLNQQRTSIINPPGARK